jgi:superfamily II DNA or RNA helicase
VELLVQWYRTLGCYIDRKKIGRRGAGFVDTFVSHDVLVGTVNAVRVRELPLGGAKRALLIADECHRYGAEVNREALDPRFAHRLGLSATYARSDDAHETVLDPYFGGSCFTTDYKRAIADHVVAPFKVALIGTQLEPREREEYDRADQRATETRRRLIQHAGVPAEPFGEFMRVANELAESKYDPNRFLARAHLNAFNRRREILADTKAKRAAIRTLTRAIAKASRTIVFTQTIEGARAVAQSLSALQLPARAIHSGLTSKERRSVLSEFAAGPVKVIVAPQILDEGIDVPEADLAILVAASKTRRQMIQRMGRVLRRKRDGRMARFAVLFVEGTSEDPALGAHEAFLSEVTDVAPEVRTFASGMDAGDVNDFLEHWGLGEPWPEPNKRAYLPVLDEPTISASAGSALEQAPQRQGANRRPSGTTPSRAAMGAPTEQATCPSSHLGRHDDERAYERGIIRTTCRGCGESVLVGRIDADCWRFYSDTATPQTHLCPTRSGPVDMRTESLPRDVWAIVKKAEARGIKIRSFGNNPPPPPAAPERVPSTDKRSRTDQKATSQRGGSSRWRDSLGYRPWIQCAVCGTLIPDRPGRDLCAACL